MPRYFFFSSSSSISGSPPGAALLDRWRGAKVCRDSHYRRDNYPASNLSLARACPRPRAGDHRMSPAQLLKQLNTREGRNIEPFCELREILTSFVMSLGSLPLDNALVSPTRRPFMSTTVASFHLPWFQIKDGRSSPDFKYC
jgi:hypothetical protein